MTESPMTFILLQIETVENLTKRLEELEKTVSLLQLMDLKKRSHRY